MRSAKFISLVIASLPLCGPVTMAYGQTSNPSDWVSDVDVLVDRMDTIHPNIYRFSSRVHWREAAEGLKHRLSGLEPHVAQLEFKRLVGLAGDGHTYFRPGGEAWGDRIYLRLFLRRFEEGWFVRTGHKDYEDLFGKRIVAIEGIGIGEIVRRLEPLVGSNNRMRILDVVPSLLRLPQVLHAVGVAENLTDAVSVTAIDNAGVELSVNVMAGPDWINDDFVDVDVAVPTPKPAYRSFDRNFDFIYYKDRNAMYFYFGEIRDGEDETVAAFGQRLFNEIETHRADKLIIDLRENNGGNLSLVQPLLHAIIRRAYPAGSLFVLIGRDTWSAAMAFAVQLERETSAIFVGEPTPSPPNFCGDTEPIELPASGIVVECSSLWWQFSDPRDERPWIAPDVAATESFDDFMAHRDVALEAVWKYQHRAEVLSPGSAEVYEVPTFELPAVRWQRESQAVYDDAWMW